MMPTMTPTEPPFTPTPSPCAELEIFVNEILFDPPQAVPGDLIEITVPVHNTGVIYVSYTEVNFAFERTPFDPSDDPNMEMMGPAVPLTDIGVGEVKNAILLWDTTGLDSTEYPLYFFTANTIPDECDPGYVQIDYLVPVSLFSFQATGGDRTVEITWVTETELNVFGFNVYRSTTFFGGWDRSTRR